MRNIIQLPYMCARVCTYRMNVGCVHLCWQVQRYLEDMAKRTMENTYRAGRTEANVADVIQGFQQMVKRHLDIFHFQLHCCSQAALETNRRRWARVRLLFARPCIVPETKGGDTSRLGSENCRMSRKWETRTKEISSWKMVRYTSHRRFNHSLARNKDLCALITC